MFQRLIYHSVYSIFKQSNPISQNQSIFEPNNSCIKELSVVTHDICSFFRNSDAFF